jgi:hypothetical protein
VETLQDGQHTALQVLLSVEIHVHHSLLEALGTIYSN